MKWEIAKQFDFCYGHRVWSQELNVEFSLDSCLACRHLHGHQGTVIIYLTGDELSQGMVTDFKHLNFMKKFIDDTLDHKFIMDVHDPLLYHEVPLFKNTWTDKLVWNENGYGTIPPELYEHESLCVREKYEGMVFVDFIPTSENLSKWIHTVAQTKLHKIGITVSRVQFFETPKSQSNFIA